MNPICKGHTKERIDANHHRTCRPCKFAAKEHGYCVHHNPYNRRKKLEQSKVTLTDQLAPVLTELIEVAAIIEEIESTRT